LELRLQARSNLSRMNTRQILEAAHATHEGDTPFPDVVATLIKAGVESYHVDYASLCTTYYGAEGDVAVTPITYEGMPAVAAELDLAALKAAIADSQRHGQKHRDFSRRAMQAGVLGYIAYLRGRRVTYLGRAGDQHTEWFPGAEPQPKRASQ
jgi:uncharacterized protein YbcV (DUF1398 family)